MMKASSESAAPKEKMKLLLLGATGDIGRHVFRVALRELPTAAITIYVRDKEKLVQLLGSVLDDPRVKVLQGDVRDIASLSEAFEGQQYCICTAGNAVKDGAEFKHMFAGIARTAAAIMVGPKRLWMMAGITVMDLPHSNSSLTLNDLPIFSWLPYRVHSVSLKELVDLRGSLNWSLMCPGKLKSANPNKQSAPILFTEEALLWMPSWLPSWPSLGFLAAIICILQLRSFSVSLEDVAEAMVNDVKTGGACIWQRVGLKKA